MASVGRREVLAEASRMAGGTSPVNPGALPAASPAPSGPPPTSEEKWAGMVHVGGAGGRWQGQRVTLAVTRSTRPIMGVASQNSTLPFAIPSPSLVASLLSWRCLAASTSSFLHAAINLRPPSVTVSIHTSAFNAVAFQSPVMPNARMSLWTQSVHSFSFPPRPLRTAPSRFPKMIRSCKSNRNKVHGRRSNLL